MRWPPLHGTDPGSLLTAWQFSPVAAGLLIVVAVGYAVAWRQVRVRRPRSAPTSWLLAFMGGVLALALALFSPLDGANDKLFLLHMLQHVVLMLIAAPLVVRGYPMRLLVRALPPRRVRSIVQTLRRGRWWESSTAGLTHPLVVFVIFNATICLWHLPTLYDAALTHDLIHELEHGMFFGAAALFWTLVIDPRPWRRPLSPHEVILLVFATAMIGDLLGLTLFLSPRLLYPFYADAPNPWGIDDWLDQRLSGLIMLASSTLVFFGTVFLILAAEGRSSPSSGEAAGADRVE